ncbi:MAG: saccharopine dehydrogenase NADP-binding domain-containing protein [Actinomycetota bacterium]|nr:saccharopine dehydrogenase NADP-binding domain-containing protein [Actinomycetota bacterium]
MNVLLLGASGTFGRRTASELLRTGAVRGLTLAGRNGGKLERLRARLQGRASLEIAAFDINDRDELARRFSVHDRVVSCAGPAYLLEEACVDAAVRSGTSYVSLNDDLEAASAVAARDDEARERGVTIISGCGAAPGITNLLIALAAEQLEEVHEVEVAIGASSADGGGPATDLHFIAMLARATRSARADDDGSRSPHPVYFPDPVGWVETFPCGHPEELAVRREHPSLASFRFRIGLAEKAVMDVIRASVATRVTATETGRRLWLKIAQPTRPLLEKLSAGAAPWTALRTDVRGRSGGRSKTISYGVVDHLVNLASIPLALAATELPPGGGGVSSPERTFESQRFLSAIATRGVRFAQLQPHAW